MDHAEPQTELDALPPALRGLHIALRDAAIELECEKRRNFIREDDLAAAELRYDEAVLAYDAAERELAEAA